MCEGMKRAVIHSTLSLLLVAATVWSGCLACQWIYAQPRTHECCKPSHCRQQPSEHRHEQGCDNQSLAFLRADSDVAKAAEAPLAVLDWAPTGQPSLPGAGWEGASVRATQHSPPDLYLLNSSIRI